MPIYEFEGARPRIAASAFVHSTAIIIGRVIIGENCFILPQVVIRADEGPIEIGDGTNIQDNAVLHGRCSVGRNSLVGHTAIIHGAKVGENVLVGMHAVILNDAEVGDGCLIGACALIPERTIIPPRKIAMGIPAAVTGDVTPTRESRMASNVQYYEELGRRHAKSLREISREDTTST